MDSFLIIEGPVLWIVIGILLVIVIIALFSAFTGRVIQDENYTLKRENAKLKEEHEDLRKSLSLLQKEQFEERYKANFKKTVLESDCDGSV